MTSFIFLIFFISGVILGKLLGNNFFNINFKTYILYLLLFFVGLQIGSDRRFYEIFKKLNLKDLIFPFISLIGSILISILIFLIIKFPLREGIAIVSGMGYYSLSSILVTEFRNEYFGVIALLTNLLRETITLIFTPLFVKIFGKSFPVASGGATTVDTTLPVIIRYSGKNFLLISIINGFILTVIVPFVIIFVLSIK